ncbi:MAG: Hsp20 family protein [Chloroflexi bacterium]|nr:Hsp20 family protein [Chloroflexota bacterium]
MTMARRASPFGELLSLRQAMDRLFEDSYVRSRGVAYGSVEALALPLDIYSTPEAIVVEAALPGVRPDDVEITVLGNTLTISGTSYEDRTSPEADFMYQELRRGTFSRTVALPSNLDTHASTATFEHGMLRLSIPKAPEAKPRQIRITPTHDSSAGRGSGTGGDEPSGTQGGNDSWAAGMAPGASDESRATGFGETDGTEGVESGQPGWEAAVDSNAWTEPSASTESWGQPEGTATTGEWQQAAEVGDTWSPTSTAEGGESWGQTRDSWNQRDASNGSTWGAGTATQDPYTTPTGAAQQWQVGQEQASSTWQVAAGGSEWEDPTEIHTGVETPDSAASVGAVETQGPVTDADTRGGSEPARG